MAKIDVEALVSKMAGAAAGVLQNKWPDARDYAETEFKKIGEAVTFIEVQYVSGKMTDQVAKLHLDLQKNAAKTVLLTLEGLGIIAVEEALNAALAAIRETVNTALGFALL